MRNYARDLTVMLLFFAIFGGFTMIGLIYGKLPGRTGGLKRGQNPVIFYFALIIYSALALASLLGAIDAALRMRHHTGLW